MSWFKPQTTLDKTYVISLALKALDGAIEVITGLLLVFIGPNAINQFTQLVTREELAENPHNILANFVLHSGQHLAGSAVLVITYLLAHGALKLIVVIALLQEKSWAYPFALAILFLFLVYQLYLLLVAFGVLLLLITAFDILVLYLIWREYQKFKIQPPSASASQLI